MLHLLPERVELWINGPHSLHDRFLYERSAGAWRITRLSP
jgi:pyridoxine/pyridoxamine 5'-phosphate oxidase